jgi:hypothetical protein
MDEERDRQAAAIGVIDLRDPPTLRDGADMGATAWRLLRRLHLLAAPGMRPFGLVSRLDSLLRRFEAGDARWAATWEMETRAATPVPLRLEPWIDEPEIDASDPRAGWGRRPPSRQIAAPVGPVGTGDQADRPVAKAAGPGLETASASAPRKGPRHRTATNLPAPVRPVGPGSSQAATPAAQAPGSGVLVTGAAPDGPGGAARSPTTGRGPTGTVSRTPAKPRDDVDGRPETAAATTVAARIADAPVRPTAIRPEPATRRFMPDTGRDDASGSTRSPIPMGLGSEAATGGPRDRVNRPGGGTDAPGKDRPTRSPGVSPGHGSLLPDALLRRVLLAFEGSAALETDLSARPGRVAREPGSRAPIRVLPDARPSMAAMQAPATGELVSAGGKGPIGTGTAAGTVRSETPPVATPRSASAAPRGRTSRATVPRDAVKAPEPATTPTPSSTPTQATRPVPTPDATAIQRRPAFVARTHAAAGSLTLSQFTPPTTGPGRGLPTVLRIGPDGTPVAAVPENAAGIRSPVPAAGRGGRRHVATDIPMALLSAGLGEIPASRDGVATPSARMPGEAPPTMRQPEAMARPGAKEPAPMPPTIAAGSGEPTSTTDRDPVVSASTSRTRAGRRGAAASDLGASDLDLPLLAFPDIESTAQASDARPAAVIAPRHLPEPRTTRAWDPRRTAPEAMAGAIAQPRAAERGPIASRPSRTEDIRTTHRRTRAPRSWDGRRAREEDARAPHGGRGAILQAEHGRPGAFVTRGDDMAPRDQDAPWVQGAPRAPDERPAGVVLPRTLPPRGTAPAAGDAGPAWPMIQAWRGDTLGSRDEATSLPWPGHRRQTTAAPRSERFAGDLAARFADASRDAAQPIGRPARRASGTRDGVPGTAPERMDAPAGAYVGTGPQAFADPESFGIAKAAGPARGSRSRETPAAARSPRAVAAPAKAATLPGIPQSSTVTWTFPATGSDATAPGPASLTPTGPTYREAWPLISTSLAAVSTVARLASRDSGPLPPAPESTRSEANDNGESVDLDGLAEEMATRILRRLKREKERRGDHGW